MLFETWRKSRDQLARTVQRFCDLVEAEAGNGHPNPAYVQIVKYLTPEMREVLQNEDLRGACDKLRVPCEIGEEKNEALLKDLCLALSASVIANLDCTAHPARQSFRISFWKRLSGVIGSSDCEVKLARLCLLVHLSRVVRTHHAMERTFLESLILYSLEFKADLIQDTRMKLISSSHFISQVKAIVFQVAGVSCL
jgi:hypothetical protein